VPGSQRWKTPRFAGCRQPSRVDGTVRILAGPSRLQGALPGQANAPATTGVLWKNEEGNVVSVRQAHALFEGDAQKAPPRTRTRPSLGPETRARQSSLNSLGSGASRTRRRWRVGRGIAVGQTHASGSEPAPGLRSADDCAARRVSPPLSNSRGSCVMRQKRKLVMATVPARNRESELSVRTSCSVAEVGRQHRGPE